MDSETSRYIRFPKKNWDYKITKFYVGKDPNHAWRHGSIAVYEKFHDVKFSVRIHWGIYSI